MEHPNGAGKDTQQRQRSPAREVARKRSRQRLQEVATEQPAPRQVSIRTQQLLTLTELNTPQRRKQRSLQPDIAGLLT